MESNARSQQAERGQLEELVELLHGADRLVARAVLLAGSGVCETVEGLALEHFLAWRHG
jgi:hypothetical protein